MSVFNKPKIVIEDDSITNLIKGEKITGVERLVSWGKIELSIHLTNGKRINFFVTDPYEAEADIYVGQDKRGVISDDWNYLFEIAKQKRQNNE